MHDELDRIERELRAFLSDLDPDRLTIAQAEACLRRLAALKRLVEGGTVLLGARAVDGDRWQRAGHPSAASWMAEIQQSSLGDAVGILETSENLLWLDQTKDALRSGKLSGAQAREIAAAAAKNPDVEPELLRAAGRDSFKELQDKARAAKAAGQAESDKEAAEQRIHKKRFLRTWTDRDGAFCLHGRMTAEAGSVVLSALERQQKSIFEEARKGDERHGRDAYMADALVALCRSKGTDSSGTGGGPPAEVTLLVDAAALMRGSLESGERCEIPGIGPVSLATARSQLGDCLLRLVTTCGEDIRAVGHPGRTIPSKVRSALMVRDPICVVPGCPVAHSLEIDHWRVPFHLGGASALDNLARLCTRHHRMKTHEGWRLVGGPGNWDFLPPEPSSTDPAGDPTPSTRSTTTKRRHRASRPRTRGGRLFDTS